MNRILQIRPSIRWLNCPSIRNSIFTVGPEYWAHDLLYFEQTSLYHSYNLDADSIFLRRSYNLDADMVFLRRSYNLDADTV